MRKRDELRRVFFSARLGLTVYVLSKKYSAEDGNVPTIEGSFTLTIPLCLSRSAAILRREQLLAAVTSNPGYSNTRGKCFY